MEIYRNLCWNIVGVPCSLQLMHYYLCIWLQCRLFPFMLIYHIQNFFASSISNSFPPYSVFRKAHNLFQTYQWFWGTNNILTRFLEGSIQPTTYFEIDQIGCPNITYSIPNFHLHMQYTMHKGTNTIYYKKGKQKGFFIELHKKVGYRSFFSVGMSEHNLSTTYLTSW